MCKKNKNTWINIWPWRAWQGEAAGTKKRQRMKLNYTVCEALLTRTCGMKDGCLSWATWQDEEVRLRPQQGRQTSGSTAGSSAFILSAAGPKNKGGATIRSLSWCLRGSADECWTWLFAVFLTWHHGWCSGCGIVLFALGCVSLEGFLLRM